MGKSSWKKGRISVKAQGAWGTAVSSWADTDVVECEILVPTPETEAVGVEVMRNDYSEPPRVAGRTRGDITVRMPIHGWSSATPSGDPTEHIDALLARLCMGASSQDGFGTLGGGASNELSYSVAPGAIDGFAVLASSTHATGRAVGWVQSVSGTDCTSVGDCRGGADFAAGQAYGGNTVYISKTVTPATLYWQGEDADSAIRYFDMGGTKARFIIGPNKQPMLEATFRYLNVSNDGSAGAPGAAAFTFPQMPISSPANGAWAALNSAEQCWGDVVFEVTRTLDEVECHSSSMLVCTEIQTRVTTTGPIEDASTLADPGDSAGPLQVDCNVTPGRAFSALIPAAVHVEKQKLVQAAGQILGVTSVFGPAPYTSDGTSVGPANTLARVVFL